MSEQMTPAERCVAAIMNQPVDRLPVGPLACGVNRRLVGKTYPQYSRSGEGYAESWVAGYRHFGYDFIVGLGDLSVIAGDVGAGVWYPEENTPMVKDFLIKKPEDYLKLEVPKIGPGSRMMDLVEGVRLAKKQVGNETIVLPLVEGPLLCLTQVAGAERVMLDMYRHPDKVHHALRVFTEIDKIFCKLLAEAGADGIVMDYLWGNYSCLGDKEYMEFEGATYAPEINKYIVEDLKIAFTIHNCADLPHLDTQVKAFKPAAFSYCYYPNIKGSLSAAEVIKEYSPHTVMIGNLDPQLFVRGTPEQVREQTIKLLDESTAALAANKLNSRFALASGCEVPPAIATKLDNIKIMVDTVKELGAQYQKRVN
jgi:uroporphyrinogen decarboxylase